MSSEPSWPHREKMTLSIEGAMARLSNLPTLPVVVHKIMDLVNDPRATATRVAQAVREDQSLTARVLRLANSSYYAVPGGVSSVERALAYLGFNTLQQLVVTASVFDNLGSGASDELRELWLHAFSTATVAELLALRIGLPEPSDCFTGGLLHDIGKVALAHIARPELLRIMSVAKAKGISFVRSEEALGSVSHRRLGAELAKLWGFPSDLRVTIAAHHQPDPALRPPLGPTTEAMLDIVMLADGLVRKLGMSGGDRVVVEPDPRILDRLNLTRLALEDTSGELMRTAEKSRLFMELLGG